MKPIYQECSATEATTNTAHILNYNSLLYFAIKFFKVTSLTCMGGSVAEWLACWVDSGAEGPGSNRSRDAVG